jgi:hypothetical protein
VSVIRSKYLWGATQQRRPTKFWREWNIPSCETSSGWVPPWNARRNLYVPVNKPRPARTMDKRNTEHCFMALRDHVVHRVVNPAVYSGGSGSTPRTILTAVFGTLLMRFYAGGRSLQALGFSWQKVLAAILVAGVVFLVSTVVRLRQWLVDAIPLPCATALQSVSDCFSHLSA